MKVKFVGGAGRVTGSCHWLVYAKTGLQLLVDCGLTQGAMWDANNQPPLPFAPARINAVLLTHAHLDHCGRIPELFSKGFQGKILCTRATAELTKSNLLDLRFQQMESQIGTTVFRLLRRVGDTVSVKDMPARESRDGTAKDKRVKISPKRAADNATKQLKKLRWDLNRAFEHHDEHPKFKWATQMPIDDDVSISLLRSSHLLGATGVSISWITGADRYGAITRKSACFSGDIGTVLDAGGESNDVNFHPLAKRTQVPHRDTDYIIMESTYGTDLRDAKYKSFADRIGALRQIITDSRFHTVVFPAFAMGRTQDILFDVLYLAAQGMLGCQCKIYMDSPSGQRATKTYLDSLLTKQGGAGYRWRNDEVTRRFFMSDEEAAASRLREKAERAADNPFHEQTDEFLRGMQAALFSRPEKEVPAESGAPQSEWIEGAYTGRNAKVVFSREIPNAPPDGEKQIIITSGGMFQGGPVLRHLTRLEKGSAAFVITGYQTLPLGKYLRGVAGLPQAEEGVKSEIPPRFRLDHETARAAKVKVLATDKIKERVFDIGSYYSGHADREGLLRYLFKSKNASPETPRNATVFLNHGESQKRYALRKLILDREPELDDFRRVSAVEIPYMNSPFFNLDTGEWEKESVEEDAKEEVGKTLSVMNRHRA